MIQRFSKKADIMDYIKTTPMKPPDDTTYNQLNELNEKESSEKLSAIITPEFKNTFDNNISKAISALNRSKQKLDSGMRDEAEFNLKFSIGSLQKLLKQLENSGLQQQNRMI